MTEGKKQLAIGFSVIAVTKYLMKHYSISDSDAYRKLMATDFYERLLDFETGLCLEPGNYLCEACLLELEQGKDAMYEFIITE